jgi:hypothetical protein
MGINQDLQDEMWVNWMKITSTRGLVNSGRKLSGSATEVALCCVNILKRFRTPNTSLPIYVYYESQFVMHETAL